MRKARLLIGSAVVSALLLTGCAGSGPGSDPGTMPTADTLSALWVDAYPSLDEMTTKADAVVTGQVQGVKSRTVEDELPYTDFDYAVDDWIKGTGPLMDAIVIHQLGGPRDGMVRIVHGDPLLGVGERSVLFLSEAGPGRFRIMGGPTGRFLLTDGRVSALPGSALADDYPQDLIQFIARVKTPA